MITCRELVELLIDFIADELPPDRRQHIEQHLCLCPPCVAYLESYRATIKLTRQLPRCAPPPPELMHRLRAAMQAVPQPKPPPPPAGGCYAG